MAAIYMQSNFVIICLIGWVLSQATPLPLRFKGNGGFKILQVADMHYADGKSTKCLNVLLSQFLSCSDLNTTAFVNRMIQAEKPDLIVFTGDNIYGLDTTNASASIKAAFEAAVAAKLPWAAVLGNHDQQSATLNREGVMKQIVSMDYTLSKLNPDAHKKIDGFGNYNLEVMGVACGECCSEWGSTFDFGVKMTKLKVLVCSVFALVVVGIPAFAENCGRQASGAVCPGGECCSEWGWCGNTADHCKVPGCQSQCGGPPGPTPSGKGVASIITENVFNQMLKHRNEGSCPGKNFYSYNAFIAAAKAFKDFGTTGDLTAQKRELAAFFAQTSHETTGGWATAPDGPYAWGYCFLRENGGGDYCNSQQAPCASGKQYYGRGPIQLSWNYNYIAAGKAIGFDGLNDPDIVTRDPTISFKTAIWFWMTAQSPKPSCHDVMTGRWKPSGSDSAAGRGAGYGVTTNIINGGLECGKGPDARVQDRIGFYKRYCDILGVSYGSNLDCFNQRPFGFALTTQQPPQIIQTVV